MFRSRKKSSRSRTYTKTQPSFVVHIVRGVVLIAVVLLILVGIYQGTRIESFTIDTVTVSGGITISHDDVHARVNQGLLGTYLGLIPKRFTYMYPKERIHALVEEVPRIHSVEISKRTRTELEITFDEYVPHALWCADSASESSCYFIDAQGYAFDRAPELRGGAFLRHYTEGNWDMMHTYLTDAEHLSDIEWFIQELEEELGFRIGSVLHKDNDDVELMVHGGGKFLIAKDKDIRTTFDNLTSVVRSEVYDHIEPGNFQYIDVRFDTKVFVNEEPIEAEVDAGTVGTSTTATTTTLSE